MLQLLLDEHISLNVAVGLRRRSRAMVVRYMLEWEGGNYLGQEDSVCLQAAASQGLTLVTYDRRTIPPLLKNWAEVGRDHGGAIFVDEKSISPADIGGLVRTLHILFKQTGKRDWTNRIYYLRG
jgi:hypothetical protein